MNIKKVSLLMLAVLSTAQLYSAQSSEAQGEGLEEVVSALLCLSGGFEKSAAQPEDSYYICEKLDCKATFPSGVEGERLFDDHMLGHDEDVSLQRRGAKAKRSSKVEQPYRPRKRAKEYLVSDTEAEKSESLCLFGCNTCGNFFETKKSLKSHFVSRSKDCKGELNRFKGPKERYFCKICPDKKFDLNGLDDHIASHTGKKKYSCSTCKKCFTMISHMNSHKCDPTKGTFPCPLCGFECNSYNSVGRHISTGFCTGSK